MLPRLITVSGLIGSGKTSVCRQIESLTGWRVISAGTILRRMAEDLGLSVIQLNERAKHDASIDQKIDDSLRALRNSAEPLVVDSRLAWHFIPTSFKVHLVVDHDIAAERVFSARRSDESYRTPNEAYDANAQRQRLENERFKHYYGIDCELWSNYNFVLDSGTLGPRELAQCALSALERQAAGPECYLDPQRLELPQNAASGEAFPVEITLDDCHIEVLAGAGHVYEARSMAAPLIHCRLA